MNRLRSILREAYGLVVDDGTLAVATLAWTGLIWVAVTHVRLPPAWAGVAFFAGLAVILVENVLRRARR